MTDQSYRWSEEAVAHLLGITKRDVKRLRKERLVPIDQVEIVAGVHMITDSGLKALGDFMKVTLPADLFSEKKDPPATTSAVRPSLSASARRVRSITQSSAACWKAAAISASAWRLRPR
jgi:hypothetical protein